MKIKKLRSRNASTSIMIAVAQIIGGGSVSIFFTFVYITMRAIENFSNIGSFMSRFFLLFLYSGIILIVRGIQNCLIYSRYRKLHTAIVNRSGAATLGQVADEFGTSPAKVLSDIEKTMNRRYWSGYGVTDTTLVLVDTANNSGTVLSGADMVLSEVRKRSRACLWFFASVWVTCVTLRMFPYWYSYILITALSIFALIAAAQLLPRKIGLEQRTIRMEEEKIVPVKTGEPEADDLLGEGLEHLKSLIELDRRIIDERLDKPVKQLLDITRQIFDYIKKTPEKSKQIRQFVKYYLPTTIKLLENYDELNRQPVKGENITEAIRKIEGIMDGILFTFSQQLDDLYRDKNIDISADIAVMENMIDQDDVLNKTASQKNNAG